MKTESNLIKFLQKKQFKLNFKCIELLCFFKIYFLVLVYNIYKFKCEIIFYCFLFYILA